MTRAVLTLAACLPLLSPRSVDAADCNRLALDLFDASRRSRTILDHVEHAERTYARAIERYEEEMPSGPGYLGVGFMVDTLGLGEVPVCAGPINDLSLGRTQWAAMARWHDASARWGLALTAVGSTDQLSHSVTEYTETDGETSVQTTSFPFLSHSQSYVGMTVRVPELVLTLGLIEVGGQREGDEGYRLDGAVPTEAEASRVHLRVALPTLSDLAADVIIGPDFDRLETALLGVAIPLPYDMVSTAEAAWLNDESRAVLRLGLTDPWDIITGDVGFETSGAVFRHARLSGRVLTPAIGLPDGIGREMGGLRRILPYMRLGAGGEVSRFSGRHLEHVTGRTGVNGWDLHALVVAHSMGLPVRVEMKLGGGRNTVDMLEHAAALVDRSVFNGRMMMTIGW